MAGYIGSKASVVSSGAERKKVFNITTSTTALTGLSYTANQVHVFHNGVRLISGTDYTETNDTTITLTTAAENGDQVVVVSYASFQTSDTVSASAGGTFSGDVTMSGDLTASGDFNVGTIKDAAGANAVDQDDLGVVADQYLVPSSISADGIITSWQRPSDASFGRKSGVTHSSGTFSFPRTGLYMVSFFFKANVAAGDNVVLNLQATTDNSTYDNIVQANCSSDGGLDNSASASTFINVDNITNVKCKLGVLSLSSGTFIAGSSNEAVTAITFLRVCGSV